MAVKLTFSKEHTVTLSRAVLLALALPAALLAQDPQPRPIVIQPDTLKWVDVASVPGAQSIALVGRGLNNGVYASRVKLAPGTKGPPHTHPDTRYTQVFSGTLYVGFGEAFDESKLVAVPAGAFYVAPARQPHFFLARDGEVLYQESGTNPTATDFIQPRRR
jgi:quercetin dioxygenase-like cupin family protein